MCGICGCQHSDQEHHHHHHEENHQLVLIEQNVLAQNEQFAASNRDYFKKHGILALNLVSSPGSGKTTLLEKTITDLKNQYSISVIEGDQQTDLDAQRIAQTRVPVHQITTGKTCHLDGHAIAHALEALTVSPQSILFIENVGNLVCPALFDLGETKRIVILSVTEGDDKPLKYPYMFQSADLMLLNKIDLLPYVEFDPDKCFHFAKQINPTIEFISLSATKGENLTEWYHWIESNK